MYRLERKHSVLLNFISYQLVLAFNGFINDKQNWSAMNLVFE